MAALKKNIWLLFFLLVLSSTVLLVSISISRWNSLTEYYRVSQQGLAAQWFGAFSSILEQQEAILTLMGEDLLKREANRPEDLQARLDDLMNLNPDFFSGFALISPQGEVLERTSNLNNNVTNILDAPEVRDSFAYALETDKMVLGRTYFAPRLAVPARKAIRNNQGEVLGVMTGALSVTGADGYFAHGHVLGDFNRITILRSRDHYVQYATSDGLIKGFHEQPMAQPAYGNLMQILQDFSEPASSMALSDRTQIGFRWDAGEDREEKPPASPEEHRLYREMREANGQLVIAALSAQHLQASAEKALAQQRNVLAVVAHELRNPLTPISIIAGRLVRVPKEELPRMQALIEGQVQHMSRLVEDLLDVSRASTGKFRLDRRIIDMHQIIRKAIDTCGPAMAARNLSFSSELPDCPLAVNGDPVRLAQILGNLLANATKYTPPGGAVRLSVTVEADAVKISISDNGIGISAQALPFIFEPFTQDVHAVDFNGAGLGIGLTVVRELVESHGGTVTGTSEGDGKGSEFIVTLPLLPHDHLHEAH